MAEIKRQRSFDVIREKGLKFFLRGVILHVLKRWIVGLTGIAYVGALVAARRLVTKLDDMGVEEACTFAFTFSYIYDIKPQQNREEILTLLRLLRELKPKVILEIGTADGGTLFLFTRVADPNATIISVDLPGDPFYMIMHYIQHGIAVDGYPNWKSPLYRSFARKTQRIYLIKSDSHNSSTLSKIKAILGGRKVDFLFIDGDHTLRGVKKDFEMYSSLVRSDGIIALHDIVPSHPAGVVGVPKFWSEIRDHYKHVEIVKDWNQGGRGIGILTTKLSS